MLNPSLIGREYVATEAEGGEYTISQRLWDTFPDDVQPPVATIQPNLVMLYRLNPLPQRIARMVAENASRGGEVCSITMDKIVPETAAVTTCFHVFNVDAIKVWLDAQPTERVGCPVCRKKCLIQMAHGPEATNTNTDNTIISMTETAFNSLFPEL